MREELQQVQKEIDARKATAAKVYDLMKKENVSIADAFQILDIVKGYIHGAERKAALP